MIYQNHGGNIYDFDRPLIDFSSNINFYGLPESAKKAIVKHLDTFSLYPDSKNRFLVDALSNKYNLSSEYILCGNGAADLIYRYVMAIRPSRALVTAPTFSEYEKALMENNCSIERYFLDVNNGFHLDPGILDYIDSSINMVFICNPNNPTGTVTDKALLVEIAKKCFTTGAFLIIDECFIDFLDKPSKYSMLSFIEKYPNIVILNAFTKKYAMAGIRLGYSLCSNTSLVKRVSELLQPWPVSTVAAVAGYACINDEQYLVNSMRDISCNRSVMFKKMNEIDSLTLFNSMANYIFFYSDNNNLYEKLLENNILIRDCTSYYGLISGYYRVAVRSFRDNSVLLSTLQEVLL